MSKTRVLIADKDPNILGMVETRLSARGYEVISFSDSTEVIRYLNRESVDLIILATSMERTGGGYLIEKIRAKPNLVRVPVIMLTENDEIAELVVSQDRGFDDFLLKPFSGLVLDLRVAMNIRKTRERIEINALTHLPGNHAIERVIRTKIDRDEKFSVVYVDINQFKSFNDLYGFDKGDDIIRQTATILVRVAELVSGDNQFFVGHVGGDDFVVVLHPDNEEVFATSFIEEFDRIIATYYPEEDQRRGYVTVKNRKGEMENTPLMSCSVAACNNLFKKYTSLGEIAHDAAEVKSFLKSQPGSHYLRDRRSEPIDRLEKAIKVLAPEMEPKKKKKRRIDPLGQILLEAGLIKREHLSAALKKHFATGQRLGQILIGMNAVKSEQVGAMLEKKLNVPYMSLTSFFPSRELLGFFSAEFVKSHRTVPIHLMGDELKIAMCDPFDLKTLDEVERITSLKPVPYLALEDEFEIFIRRYEAELGQEEKIG